jgi:hypothetical protein
LINKQTNESKVVGMTTKKISAPEGIATYGLLDELATDVDQTVKDLAKNEIEKVQRRLKEKEASIDERISKQPKEQTITNP